MRSCFRVSARSAAQSAARSAARSASVSPPRRTSASALTAAMALSLSLAIAWPAVASRLVMKDGRVIEGQLAQIGSIDDKPNPGVVAKTTVLVDDGLRRTFVPQRQIQEANELDAK